jgi:RNase P subunit RPR2
MDRSCQHCGELIVGNAYRVTSEEDGITLLDIVVCSRCSMEAWFALGVLWKRSGFASIRSKSTTGANQLQHGIGVLTVHDSEFELGFCL